MILGSQKNNFIDFLMIKQRDALINKTHELEYDPARALRWGLSFVFPLINQFIIWFEWNVWMKLVREENKHKV